MIITNKYKVLVSELKCLMDAFMCNVMNKGEADNQDELLSSIMWILSERFKLLKIEVQPLKTDEEYSIVNYELDRLLALSDMVLSANKLINEGYSDIEDAKIEAEQQIMFINLLNSKINMLWDFMDDTLSRIEKQTN